MTTLTRRQFMTWGGFALAGAGLRPLPLRDLASHLEAKTGRITEWSVWVREEPDHGAPTARQCHRDDIVTYFEAVRTTGRNPHNPVWFRVVDGYIYSSYVQPVEVNLNEPIQHLPATMLWGEISVPYTDARYAPSTDGPRSYRLRYGSVYRIVQTTWGADGHLWYWLRDNRAPSARQYVRAEHVRPLFPEDLAPISPRVSDKRIEISLADQSLTAYESGKAVLSTLISGGTGGGRATPRGHHKVTFKAPSRHMVGDDFDLPGVCFDTYFWGGVAIHGTYWHNDYGRPRSHGCVNIAPWAAKWIYRWTVPVAPYHEEWVTSKEGGTAVVVE